MPAPPGSSTAANWAAICHRVTLLDTVCHRGGDKAWAAGQGFPLCQPWAHGYWYGNTHPFPQKNGNRRGAVLFHHWQEGNAGRQHRSSSLCWRRTWKLNWSPMCWVRRRRRAGVKRRGDSLPTSASLQLKYPTSDGKTELIQSAKKIAG